MNEATFLNHWQTFCMQSQHDGRFALSGHHWQKQLHDDTPTTGDFSFCYVIHCGWGARMLAKYKPKRHVDFGSYVYFISCASAIPESFEFYDIRPANLPLPGLTCGKADLKHLQFPDNSIESISCMHVMEHVGLGRYSDEVDALGDLTAAKELMRVLAPGGRLYMVLPMNQNPTVVFNAHRLYTYEMIAMMFSGLVIDEFAVVKHIGSRYIDPASPSDIIKGNFDVDDAGCFVFRKPEA